MGRYYFDSEYTSGNYYIGDIFEIAIVAEKSGDVYHSFVQIGYRLPHHIKFMGNITDTILKDEGRTFNNAFKSLIDFIKFEEIGGDDAPISVAHGEQHFPLLLANCLKNNCDTSFLMRCNFIDSVIALHNVSKNSKCGLNTLAKIHFNENITHSARKDVILLKRVFELSEFQCMLGRSVCTSNRSCRYLNARLPLSFDEIKTLAKISQNKEHLCFLLWSCEKKTHRFE